MKKIRKILSVLLAVCVLMGALPVSVSAAQSYEEAHIWLQNTNSGTYEADKVIYDAAQTASDVSGMTYDRSTNTLTLTNYNGSDKFLDTEEMGDLTLEVVGDNELLGMIIGGHSTATGLTITGSGTLALNKGKVSFGPLNGDEGVLYSGISLDTYDAAEPSLTIGADVTVTIGEYSKDGSQYTALGIMNSSSATIPMTYGGRFDGSIRGSESGEKYDYNVYASTVGGTVRFSPGGSDTGVGAGDGAYIKLINISDDSVDAVIYDKDNGVNPSASSATQNLSYNPTSNTLSTNGTLLGTRLCLEVYQMGSDFKFRVDDDAYLAGIKVTGSDRDAGLNFSGSGKMIVNINELLSGTFGDAPIIVSATKSGEPSFNAGSLNMSVYGIYNSSDDAYDVVAVEGSTIPPSDATPVGWDGVITGGALGYYSQSRYVCVQTSASSYSNYPLYVDGSGNHYALVVTDVNNYQTCAHEMYEITNWDEIKDQESTAFSGYYAQLADTAAASATGRTPDGYTMVVEYYSYILYATTGKLVLFEPPEATDQPTFTEAHAYFDQGDGGVLAEGNVYAYATVTGDKTPTAVVNYTDSSSASQTLTLTVGGSNGSYSFKGALPADARSVQSVVFTLTPDSGDPITKTVEVEKNVKSCLTVTLTEKVKTGSKLSVIDSGSTVALTRTVNAAGSYDLGYLAPGTYSVKVTYPSESGRALESGSASVTVSDGAKATASVSCSEVTVTTVAPKVTPATAAYTLYWYDAAAAGNLIATGASYDILNSETVYVCAVPTGSSILSYSASSRTAVTSANSAPSLTLGAPVKRTISGKVTMGGNAVSGASVAVTVTAPGEGSSFSTTFWGVTNSSGNYSITGVPQITGGTVKVSVSHPLASDFIETVALTADLTKNITLTAKQGAVECRWDPIAVAAEASNQSVPVTLRSGVLYLDPDKLTANGTVKLHLENLDGYADVTVTLDSNKCGKVSDSLRWSYYSRPYFELNNPSRGSFCLLTYDSNGKLVDTDLSAELDGEQTVRMFGNYRSQGTYTFLFLVRDAYCSLESAQTKTLSDLKSAIGTLEGSGTLYLEKTVSLPETTESRSSTVSVSGSLPTGTIPALALNRSTSGLTLDADEKYVSARVSIAPTDITKVSKELTVLLETNQVSDNGGPNVNIVPGSLYINSRKAGEDVALLPGTQANTTYFDGTYQITIPDVSKYGGYPVTVQWQSSRATSGTVTASALVRFGTGSRQFVGSGEVADPIVSLYVPSSVGDSTFTVYGYAPAGAEVNIHMDDIVAASVVSDEKTGFYSAMITLDDPIGYEEHSFQAQSTATDGANSYTCDSAVQKTVYSSSLPHISRIEISNYTDSGTVLLWDNGAPTMGYYWYLPETPVTYFISFDNITDGKELESVTVHLPRSDGVKLLNATYNSGTRKWETEPFRCGNTPPTGAWVSYVVANTPVTLTDTDFTRLAALESAGTIPTGDKITGTNNVDGLTASAITGGVSVKVNSLGLTQEQTRSTDATAKVAAMQQTINAKPKDSASALSLYGISKNAVYNTVAQESGKWVYRYIEKISDGAGSNALWQETVMTESSYTVTIVDDKADYVETVAYKLDSSEEISVTVSADAGNNAPAEALEILQTAWAEKVLAYQNEAIAAMSQPTGSTVAASFRASSRSSEPTNVWDDNGYALTIALLINCIEANQGDPQSDTTPLAAQCGPTGFLGGGLYKNLKWMLGAEKLKVLKDYIDDAMDISGTGGDISKLAEWAQGKMEDSAWDKFKSLFGSGDDQEIHDLKKRVYDAMVEAEKEGQHIDWSKFPGFDKDFPDPRAAKDIHTITKDEKGNNLYGGKKWNQLTQEERDELLRWSKEKQKQREDEKGDAVPDTSKPIIDPSGFVYEGVESNRVEGVAASLYEVNATSGAKTLWPAAEYDQTNPQVTDQFGQYQWMVPEGWWSVTFTKDGYTPYTTGEHDGTNAVKKGDTWAMPVAPAQLDVNINLQREDNPTVEDVKVTAEGIYVIFSQYMVVFGLKSGNVFTATINGVATEFTASDIECKDEENGYARTVLLKKTIQSSDIVNAVEVKDTVSSYTGKTMTSNYLKASGLEIGQTPKTDKPTISPATGGEVPANTAVTLTAASGAAIYYTVDGTDPTTASTRYTGPFLVTGSMTIKCMAVEGGKLPSDVVSLTVTVPTETQNETQGNPPGGTSSGESEDEPCDGGEGCPGHAFTDVDTKQWYHEAVDYVIENGLMNGYGNGKFAPNANLSRAMLCQIFYNKEGKPAVTAENPFTDVPAGQWYTDAVVWAYENKIVDGYGGGKFGPTDDITREQLAAILWRYDGEKVSAVSLDAFSDAGKISSYAVDALKWAYENKVVSGKGNGILDPIGKATRAEVAQMLMNYLEK